MANAGSNNDHVAAILSIPVCGVETRKDIDAALEAPFRRMATAVGNTPHEHKDWNYIDNTGCSCMSECQYRIVPLF